LLKKFLIPGFAITVVSALIILSGAALAQKVTALTHQPPDGAQITFQLTDGTVLAQGFSDADWWKLTPDITGSYVKGTWTEMARLHAGYVPEDFA
jgi:hypothetical protein